MGGRATLLLESAIGYARGVQGASCPPAGLERARVDDPRLDFADEIERLIDWAETNSIPVRYASEKPFGTQDAEGTEHLVWIEGDHVRKISFASFEHFNQGPFGQTIEAFEDVNLAGERVVVFENRKGSPAEYLERLYLQNILFRINNTLEAVSENGIETTQPLFLGETISKGERDVYLAELGFAQVAPLTFYHSELAIALSDLAPYNIIRTKVGIFPFDIWARRIAVSDADLTGYT